MEDHLKNGRKIRTLYILDDYNSEVIAMEVSFSFPAERVIEVLTQGIEWRGKPKIICSNNGTLFDAMKTKEFFAKNQIDHIPFQKVNQMQNGYVERFNPSLGGGVQDANTLTTIDHARQETNERMEALNINHLHGSLEE